MYSAKSFAALTATATTFAYLNLTSLKVKSTQAESRLKPPYFSVGKTLNPKFEKRFKGGEDALVISKDSRFLSVCDGVGGWNDVGVDPGLFSKYLCVTMGELYDVDPKMTLKNILVEAVKKNPHKGSSTAVLVKLEADRSGRMTTCNLGDSGYMIFRQHKQELKQLYVSDLQTYSFDFPYQCGTNCDLPYDAKDNEHEVQHNDIVILATDGVLDNLFEGQISKCIKNNMRPDGGDLVDLQDVSDCISTSAEAYSYRKDYFSPYTKSAVEHGKDQKEHLGGKPDDITVIAA